MNAGMQPCEDAIIGRTAQIEQAVAEAYRNHLAPVAPDRLAVLAVGGFGRGELFPHSDVDLLLLVDQRAVGERQRGAIATFLRTLWDAGMRVSHSVRTIADCASLDEGNVELSVSLIDQRLLSGDRGLHDSLGVALVRFFHGQHQALSRQLCRMARERHAKFGGSIHQLEPNVKESPGGLRDYQTVRWLARLRNAEVPATLEPAREFLFHTRIFLHERACRDANVLTFDLQDEIAERDGVTAAEWMRRYYGNARAVFRAAVQAIETVEEQGSPLLTGFRDWRSRLSNSEFYVSRERVYFRAPHRIPHDPLLVLRLFEFVGRHGMRLAQETERRIAEYRPSLRFSSPLWPSLEAVLRQPHAALALRAMEETGVLSAIFPEWSAVECLVIRDFFHRYTVDEHTLRAIQALADLRAERDPALQPFQELLSEIDQPALIRFALLFHDLGKASQGAHVTESLRMAEGAMERIGMPEEARRTVRTLIEMHLQLSEVIVSRDLEDPATARYVAERAGTLEMLKLLTLVTYADVSAVNPTAFSPWRREQLWRVYVSGHNELTRELVTDRIPSDPLAGLPGAAEFLEGFPRRYLLRHTESQIAAHFALAQRSADSGAAVELSRQNGFYSLTVVTRDRPALLAAFAGALAGFGMNIAKAEAFANGKGIILDSFVFTDPHRTLELNPTESDRLTRTLERVALGRLDVRDLLRSRPAPKPPSRRARIHPTVSFDTSSSAHATLIQVIAEDRPGLLYVLASAISSVGANIEVALIDTEAHKAIDAFYVTLGGEKLKPAAEGELKAKLLAACNV